MVVLLTPRKKKGLASRVDSIQLVLTPTRPVMDECKHNTPKHKDKNTIHLFCCWTI